MSMVDKMAQKLKGGSFVLIEKDEMQAVHEDDLKTFLKSLGVYEAVAKGRETCYFCNEKISMDNLQCILPIDNEVKFCCNNEICYDKLVEKGIISK